MSIDDESSDALKTRVAGWLQRWLAAGVGSARFMGGMWIGAGNGDTQPGCLRLEGSLLGSTAQAAIVSGAAQMVTSGVDQALAFDSIEHDPFGMVDPAMRLSVPESGVYLLGGCAGYAAGGGGSRRLSARANGSRWLGAQILPAVEGAAVTVSLAVMAALNAGDTLELLAWQDSGVALAAEVLNGWIVRQA